MRALIQQMITKCLIMWSQKQLTLSCSENKTSLNFTEFENQFEKLITKISSFHRKCIKRLIELHSLFGISGRLRQKNILRQNN